MEKEEMNGMIERYADMVFRIALIYCRNCYEDAEDVFQEVFLALVKKRRKFQSEEHCKAWLVKVTMNQCKKKYHSRQKMVLLGEEKLWEKMEQGQDTEQEKKSSLLYQLVCDLPLKYRDVVELYYFEEFSSKEIAKMLKLSDMAVRKRLSRGREILRSGLKGESQDEGKS